MAHAAQWMPMLERPALFEDRPCTILAWRQGHSRYLIRIARHPGTLDVPASKLRPIQVREPHNATGKKEG